jgi:hypothetical protein
MKVSQESVGMRVRMDSGEVGRITRYWPADEQSNAHVAVEEVVPTEAFGANGFLVECDDDGTCSQIEPLANEPLAAKESLS